DGAQSVGPRLPVSGGRWNCVADRSSRRNCGNRRQNRYDSLWTRAKRGASLCRRDIEKVAGIALVQFVVVRTGKILLIVFFGETPKPIKRIRSKDGPGETAQMFGKQICRSGIALEHSGPCDAPFRGCGVRRGRKLLLIAPIEARRLIAVQIHSVIVSCEEQRVIRPGA